jgi:glycine cleavage system transcriptional repressor
MNDGSGRRYVLNVMAEDRPGIVSAVSGAVADLGGNIEAVSQTVLKGYFTLIMIVSMPPNVSSEHLERVVGATGGERAFMVLVRSVAPAALPAAPTGSESFVITVTGEDRPGTIFRVSSYLAEKGVNITDLYGDRQQNRFVLVSQVQVPPQWDIAMLQADLEHIGEQMGFTVRMQHENVFVATNELRLRRESSP